MFGGMAYPSGAVYEFDCTFVPKDAEKTREQLLELKQAMLNGTYVGDRKVSTKAVAKRRTKNKLARRSRGRNR